MSQRLTNVTPLLLLTALVALAFAVLHWVPARYANPPVFTVIALATLLGAVTIVVRRRAGTWSTLAAGMLAILLAVSWIYVRSLGGELGWPTWRPALSAELIRAMFVGGGLFFLLGLAFDWIEETVGVLPSTDGVALVVGDQLGIIRETSEAFDALIGSRHRELVGHDILEIIPERYRSAHIAAFDAFVRTGKQHIIGTPVALAMRCRSGDEIPVTLTLATTRIAGELGIVAVIESREVPHG